MDVTTRGREQHPTSHWNHFLNDHLKICTYNANGLKDICPCLTEAYYQYKKVLEWPVMALTPCAACTVRSRVMPLHTYTSPFRAPEYVSSSLAADTHRMVCRSPAFPKRPLLGVRALPHRVQNYRHKQPVRPRL